MMINLYQLYALGPRTTFLRIPRSSREKTAGRLKKKRRLTKRLPNLQSSTNKRTVHRVNEKTLHPVHGALN